MTFVPSNAFAAVDTQSILVTSQVLEGLDNSQNSVLDSTAHSTIHEDWLSSPKQRHHRHTTLVVRSQVISGTVAIAYIGIANGSPCVVPSWERIISPSMKRSEENL